MAELMIIENRPDKAALFDAAGIDRIFVDLEILGKDERQGHLNTVISRHSFDDIKSIKAVLKNAKLLARINPVHSETKDEVEKCISNGADIIMLPMFRTPDEVDTFLKAVKGRVKVNLLVETPDAARNINQILETGKIDEVHIGLNDLHLALGKKFMMEMYVGNFLSELTQAVTSKGISLGIGGIASLDGGLVPGRLIAAEAYRLGGRRFILSRAFPKDPEELFRKELLNVRQYFESLEKQNESFFADNKIVLLDKIDHLKK